MTILNFTERFCMRFVYEAKHYIFLTILFGFLLFNYIYTSINNPTVLPVSNSMFLTLVITFYLIIYSAKSITQELKNKTIYSYTLFYGVEAGRVVIGHFLSLLILSFIMYASLLVCFLIFNLLVIGEIFAGIDSSFLWVFLSNMFEGFILMTVSFLLAIIFKSNIFANVAAILFFFLTPLIRNSAREYAILNFTFFPHMNIANAYENLQSIWHVIFSITIVIVNLGLLASLAFLLVKKQDIRI